jgi:hypothetical protein
MGGNWTHRSEHLRLVHPSKLRQVPKVQTLAAEAKALVVRLLTPVLAADLLMSPLWLFHYYERTAWLPIAQCAITALLAPAFIAGLTVITLAKSRLAFWPIAIALSLMTFVFANIIPYSFWGIATGAGLHPDGETVLLTFWLAIIGGAIISAPLIFFFLMRVVVALRKSS